MAIGSAPEVGVEFSRWGEMTEEARSAWFKHIVDEWGADLQGGYAKVVFPNSKEFLTASTGGNTIASVTKFPSPNDDVIDSRDVIEAIRLLDAEDMLIPESVELLHNLRDLDAQGVDCAPDWSWGETVIADHYFAEYAKELVHECYSVPSNWPFNCIDWQRVAEELRSDYTAVTFGGKVFWVR